MSRDVIDEDICAACAHLCLLGPKEGYPGYAAPSAGGPWHAPASCAHGWPITAVFWNVTSECPRYEKATSVTVSASEPVSPDEPQRIDMTNESSVAALRELVALRDIREQIEKPDGWKSAEWAMLSALEADYMRRKPIAWAAARAALSAAPVSPLEPFQKRMDAWLMACFGEKIARDKVERNHRFLEEALELVQALGCTADEARQLVDYTFGRPAGDAFQEVGGVVTTLAALCSAQGFDMDGAAEAELARIWTKVEQIRAKQAAKPKHSPLPAALAVQPQQPQQDQGASPSGTGLCGLPEESSGT